MRRLLAYVVREGNTQDDMDIVFLERGFSKQVEYSVNKSASLNTAIVLSAKSGEKTLLSSL